MPLQSTAVLQVPGATSCAGEVVQPLAAAQLQTFSRCPVTPRHPPWLHAACTKAVTRPSKPESLLELTRKHRLRPPGGTTVSTHCAWHRAAAAPALSRWATTFSTVEDANTLEAVTYSHQAASDCGHRPPAIPGSQLRLNYSSASWPFHIMFQFVRGAMG